MKPFSIWGELKFYQKKRERLTFVKKLSIWRYSPFFLRMSPNKKTSSSKTKLFTLKYSDIAILFPSKISERLASFEGSFEKTSFPN